MKILKMSAYYDPEQIASSHLTADLEEALVENGFEIEIYTPSPTRNVSEQIRKIYKNRKYEERYNGAIKIHRFGMIKEGKNPIIRAFRYILCNIKQYFFGIRARDVDLILGGSTPPTQGLLCAMVKRRLKVPFIYDLQDIFPDSLVNTGLTKKNSVLWKLGRILENKTYKEADRIIVISEGFKRNIMGKGVAENKISVVRNWINEDVVVNISRSKNKLFDDLNLDRNKFYICYSGNIGHTQNMEMLLDVAKSLTGMKEICFVIIGEGAYKKKVVKRIEVENIDNVLIFPFQPYERISEVFSLGDVGLVISKAGIGINSVPSKTWSIMSAERPVLASFDRKSELATVIKHCRCGICVEANQPDKLRDGILEMYNKKEQLEIMGKSGRQYILENLTKSKSTEKRIKIIQDMFVRMSSK